MEKKFQPEEKKGIIKDEQVQKKTEENFSLPLVCIIPLKKSLIYVYGELFSEVKKNIFSDWEEEPAWRKKKKKEENKAYTIESDPASDTVLLRMKYFTAPLKPFLDNYAEIIQKEGKIPVHFLYYVYYPGMIPVARLVCTIELTYDDFVDYRAEVKILSRQESEAKSGKEIKQK